MSSIITITLNPAIDKSTSVVSMISEKKMRCSPPVFEPGGGGVNVARAIHKLGGKAVALYFAGGYTGKFFNQLLNKEGIESAIIEIAKHTRENLIVVDSSSNRQYRFGMPGPDIEEQEWKQLLHTIENMNDVAFMVASGSVPAGAPTDIFARIAAIAKRKQIKLIVDTSGEALQQAADEGVYLLKPNLGELSVLAGKDELNTSSVIDAAKELLIKKQTEVVVVSMGAAGAILVTKDMAQQINAPVVKIKSTVGAGDSMVAGIVQYLSKGKTLTESVQYGIACGTAATINPGTELCRLEDVEDMYRLISRS